MLYEWFAADRGILNLLNYITFRSGAAVVTAFLVTVIFGDSIINFLRARQGKGQPIRDLSLQQQLEKRGTPTMGGFLIWLGLLAGTLLWADLKNPYIWVTLFVTLSYALLGFLDDYAKVTKQTDAGVSAKVRLLAGFGIAALACAFIMGLHGAHTPAGHAEWGPLNGLAERIADLAPKTSITPADPDFSGGVAVPFINNYFLPLGMFFILFGMVVVVG
ncbi:MAG TPA: phospho-N-acetylmuramoyl-pentapeptide-transferase, partial [Hyphomonas sp.]|nr:phospho-N-acetylmuramoyl-pentapeptide-transferase [Hyphomonas sp.]